MDPRLERSIDVARRRGEPVKPGVVTEAWRAGVARAHEYMSLFDLDLRITFMNRLQPGIPDVVGMPVLSCIEPNKHEAFLEATAAAYLSGLPHYYETGGTGPGGRAVAYRSWVVPLSGREGPATFASISVDITHLGRVQRELEEQTSVLDTLVRNAPDSIAVLDRDLRVLFINHAQGLELSDVLGADLCSFIPEQHRDWVRGRLERVFQSAASVAFEGPFEVGDNTRWFSTRVGPILRDGLVERVLLVSTDITEAHNAAEERRALEAQLAQAQKMQALGQLTGGVAHDFNNLLTVIMASLSLLKSSKQPEVRAHELLLQAEVAAQRGAALTQRLLAFSRRQPLRPEAIDPRKLLTGMEQLLARTLPENIALRMEVKPDTWPCMADLVQLESALLNLAINARDAMPNGGSLSIAVGNVRVPAKGALAHEGLAPGDYVSLEVADSGTGMTPEVLAQAFEPFFTTKDVGVGSGLGLSMVYGFAKQSRGEVKLTSRLGSGTTVQLYLPRSSSSVPTAELPAGTISNAGDGQLVLVVEDDPAVCHLVCEMLARIGYQTISACDGPAAQHHLSNRADIALLLVDMMLPGGISGSELVQAVRSEHPALPVLFMTGYSNDAVSSDPAIQLRLLPKPFSESALATAIGEALRAARS